MRMTLRQAIAAAADARADAVKAYKDGCRASGEKPLTWAVSRGPRLLAIDARGERIDDYEWVEWKRRMSDVDALIAKPNCVEVVIDGGVDFYANRQDAEIGLNYDTEFWQCTIYTKDAP